ncbi:hypothetical protein YC2023_017804 [Brassica napus]
MCQNKSGWREDGVDLLVFSLSRFLSSTKPLSLLILFFSSVAPPFSDLSISVAPPSPIYLSRWLSSVIYLSSPFYLSRFLSSSNRFGLLSRIISSVTSLSLFGDLSLCGSLRGRRNPLSVALLKSKDGWIKLYFFTASMMDVSREPSKGHRTKEYATTQVSVTLSSALK